MSQNNMLNKSKTIDDENKNLNYFTPVLFLPHNKWSEH